MYFAGDSELQLSSIGCGRSIFYSRRRQLRNGSGDETAVRGLPARRLHHQGNTSNNGNSTSSIIYSTHHQGRHGRHQDVLHTGGRRRHIHKLRRRGNQTQRRILFRR